MPSSSSGSALNDHGERVLNMARGMNGMSSPSKKSKKKKVAYKGGGSSSTSRNSSPSKSRSGVVDLTATTPSQALADGRKSLTKLQASSYSSVAMREILLKQGLGGSNLPVAPHTSWYASTPYSVSSTGLSLALLKPSKKSPNVLPR